MRFGHLIFTSVIAFMTAAAAPAMAQTAQPGGTSSGTAVPYRFKLAAEHPAFEWFFLLIDAGKEQGIWTKHGLDPEFVPAAGPASEIKERVGSGVRLGYVSTAEVTLARSSGVPVKTVAGYVGDTLARLFVAGESPIKSARDLDGRKVGIVAANDTSYRAVLYVNKRLSINAEPVALGSLANNVAALKSGRIDAFYSAEGGALALLDSGELRVLVPLSDVYPKPYTAVVAWAADDLIADNPELVKRFVAATLEAVQYLKDHPDYVRDRYIARRNAPKAVADKVADRLIHALSADGRGSGGDLVAAVAGNWKFMTESGAVPASTVVNIDDVVDARFLPSQ
jgi:NitT/TauT family transport system substrate-binding protein